MQELTHADKNDGTTKPAEVHTTHYYICAHCILYVELDRQGPMSPGEMLVSCPNCSGSNLLDEQYDAFPTPTLQ